MFFSGSGRLAEAEPGFAELAAELDALLARGGAGQLDPGDLAAILGKSSDTLRRLLERATDPEIDLLVPVEMLVCPHCDCLNELARVERELDELGESDCSRCGRPLDLDRAKTVRRYRPSEAAEIERHALDRRPKRCAVILTAIAVEYAAVIEQLGDVTEATVDGTIYNTGGFASLKNVWTVSAAQIGAGNFFSAAATIKALTDTRPDVALFVGIAGGLKDDVSLGDVVAADKVHGYEPGKTRADAVTLRPEQMRGTHALVQRAQEVARIGSWPKRIVDPWEPEPKAIVSEIASGEKLVASAESDLYQQLRGAFDRCVAVEMEGIGFLIATYLDPSAQALVIRGISDMVENKAATDHAGWQQRAARAAAAFAFEFLATL